MSGQMTLEDTMAKRRRDDDDDYDRDGDRSSGGGIAVHPSIIAGVFMMVGAVVWFVLGYMAGRIFIYPPILFVLGIGSVIAGFRGTE
jgi:hypothetical protein